jgi:hypothetical protein
VGIQDDNAIAAAKRISWLILDIAINVFSKLLLKMIKEVLFASGGLLVKPTSSGEIRVTSYSLVRNGARFMWIAAR